MSLLLNRTIFGKPSNAGNILSKAEANKLFASWVLNPRLQLHMKQVAQLMKSWAAEKELLNERQNIWEKSKEVGVEENKLNNVEKELKEVEALYNKMTRSDKSNKSNNSNLCFLKYAFFYSDGQSLDLS
jgi:hypothetical protein